MGHWQGRVLMANYCLSKVRWTSVNDSQSEWMGPNQTFSIHHDGDLTELTPTQARADNLTAGKDSS